MRFKSTLYKEVTKTRKYRRFSSFHSLKFTTLILEFTINLQPTQTWQSLLGLATLDQAHASSGILMTAPRDMLWEQRLFFDVRLKG